MKNLEFIKETKAELIDAAYQAGYSEPGSFQYGPFKHSPPSNPKNFGRYSSRNDLSLLSDISFPKIVKSAEEIRSRIYRNLLVQGDRDNIYTLLKLPGGISTSTDTLLHATRDFKKENEPYENPHDFTGSCGATSLKFAKLCSDRYGMDIEDLHFGDGENFFHQVAVRGNIVIDWTVRQFKEHKESPYPYIYRMGTPNTFFNRTVERDPERVRWLIMR